MVIKMNEELDTGLEDIQLNAIIRNGSQLFTAPVISISRRGLKFTSQDIFRIGEKVNLELQLELGKITSILRVNAKIINMFESDEDSNFTDYEVKYSFFGLRSKYSKQHTALETQ
jgi:hypothetical protein